MNKIVSIVAIIALTSVYSFSQELEDKFRFGIRTNGGSIISGVKLTGFNSNKSVGIGGNTAGFGAFALIPCASVYFVPEISFQFREPVMNFSGQIHEIVKLKPDSSFKNLNELAIDIPLMFRFRYREENSTYLGIGPLLGVVLVSGYFDDGYVKNKYRDRIDYGFAVELGYRVNKNFSIDMRSLGSFASTGFLKYIDFGSDDYTNMFIQNQIGLSYTF